MNRCEDTKCVCSEGWTGLRCESQDCDPRCNLHGQCKNGTCLCVPGWNGKHCTLEGCPNECRSSSKPGASRHGECKRTVSFSANSDGDWWACQCNEGWEGDDCSVKLETYCDDGYDNDQGKKKKDLTFDCYSTTFVRVSLNTKIITYRISVQNKK